MEKTGALKINGSAWRTTILDDKSGDAIDSVIAAFATFRALCNRFVFDENSPYAIDGWVYV